MKINIFAKPNEKSLNKGLEKHNIRNTTNKNIILT